MTQMHPFREFLTTKKAKSLCDPTLSDQIAAADDNITSRDKLIESARKQSPALWKAYQDWLTLTGKFHPVSPIHIGTPRS